MIVDKFNHKYLGVLVMSSLVCHVEKFKQNDIKGIEIHNERKSNNLQNKEIDLSRKEQNYDLVNSDPNINYSKKVDEIIANNYTGTKKIATTGKKSATKMVGILISSDKVFFDKLSSDKQKNFFQTALSKIKERYPHIISAKVHLDEHTPHMHVMLVPISKDGRLSAKTEFDRTALKKLQDNIPKTLKEKGFDIQRGIEGSANKHLSEIDYKIKKESEKLSTIEQKIQQYKNDNANLEEHRIKLNSAYKSLNEAIKKYNNEFNELENKQKELETRKNKFHRSQNMLEQKILDYKSEYFSIVREIEKQENNIKQAKERLDEVEMQYNTIMENKKTTESNILKATEEIKILKEQQLKAENTINLLTEAIVNKPAQNAHSKNVSEYAQKIANILSDSNFPTEQIREALKHLPDIKKLSPKDQHENIKRILSQIPQQKQGLKIK